MRMKAKIAAKIECAGCGVWVMATLEVVYSAGGQLIVDDYGDLPEGWGAVGFPVADTCVELRPLCPRCSANRAKAVKMGYIVEETGGENLSVETRLQCHIVSAKDEKEWGAVASLERLLAEIRGAAGREGGVAGAKKG